ncbi:hypothetical protein IF1G_06026 [Cordyceps javanica]|uniref:Uncharacterized protein n=1 Tax=Cordyceps javanica TaxID=43265 RepID=A0A545V034_9HYPO|nr:hypothetical protein IF1G_06026 [Cordyceps javanica]
MANLAHDSNFANFHQNSPAQHGQPPRDSARVPAPLQRPAARGAVLHSCALHRARPDPPRLPSGPGCVRADQPRGGGTGGGGAGSLGRGRDQAHALVPLGRGPGKRPGAPHPAEPGAHAQRAGGADEALAESAALGQEVVSQQSKIRKGG